MRLEKKAIVKEIRDTIEGKNYAFLMNFKGLKVEQINSLRVQLAQIKARLLVVKNTFFKRVAEELGWGDVSKFMDGPSAVVAGTGDVSKIAKLLKSFKKENGLLVVKGGRFGDRLISASDIEAIANIPPIEIMRAKLVGTIAAPMTQLVGVMQQKVCSLLYVLKAVEEKKAKGQ
ncbi:MAG: 50S ribosomal protein L10 [Kiritimatiellae bacterium]|nr:50S ribosomal protein L10 [Kiritimatiellia bacterium]MDD5522220.1 50S ribosomal protein L10 [Kiritimatiellia bacterium]